MTLIGVKSLASKALLLLSLFVSCASAQTTLAVDETDDSYLVRIELHTADELLSALQRSDQFFQDNNFTPQTPIALILHGAEAKIFFREAYRQNQDLVDLAAKLSALKVVDIKVCKTWMGSQALDENQLLPFVGTVPFGPAEERRLMQEQGYRYF